MPTKTKPIETDIPGLGPLKAMPERKSLGQMVYENLRQTIVRGSIAPGTRLVESQIAEAQGISRTPVREAIHKLERERFIERLPHGGFSVLELSREEIVETFGIRSVLEGYAARLAAINHQPGQLKRLKEKIDEFQRLLDTKHLEGLPQVNTEFHDLLYALSNSPRLIRMIDALRDHIYRYRQIILKEAGRARTSNEDHRLILESIRTRDAEGVEQLVREHILRGQQMALNAFESDGFR
ncbi:MAG: GntR family transcriptional regulator [Deltaproteobacteria bacterium]|nr:GntR family transcriptional regulator [Deltaproteobacteria bacterium]